MYLIRCEQKKWGRVHQDLGQNEPLPLPHTKGTKPAPSTVKVLVYLIQVKKKNKVVFLYILKTKYRWRGSNPHSFKRNGF